MGRTRLATSDDAEALWSLHTRAIRERVASHYTPDQIASWAGHLRPATYHGPIASARVWVLEDAGQVVAFGQLGPGLGEVEALYVDPDHTGRGHGGALLRFLEEQARGAGHVQIHLSASVNAVRFYRRMGYRVVGDTEHCLPNGGWLRCVDLTKGLPSPPEEHPGAEGPP